MNGFVIRLFSNTSSVYLCTLEDNTAILLRVKHLFLKFKLRLLRNIQLQPQSQLPCVLPRAGLYHLQFQQQGSRFLPAFNSRHAIFFLSGRSSFSSLVETLSGEGLGVWRILFCLGSFSYLCYAVTSQFTWQDRKTEVHFQPATEGYR